MAQSSEHAESSSQLYKNYNVKKKNTKAMTNFLNIKDNGMTKFSKDST